jgi:amino acid adenylation domain-containing protein
MDSIYKKFNSNVAHYPTGVTLHAMIAAAAEKFPSHVASRYQDDAITYQQLDQRSNQLANYLIQQGVQAGTLVGLCCQRNIDVAVMILAILKTGAGYVPLDPDYPSDRIQFMAEDSELSYVVGHSAEREMIESLGAKYTLYDSDVEAIDQCGADCPDRPVDPKTSIAYVIYTSGSTGQPKGCLVPHAPAVNQTFAMGSRLEFSDRDSLLATTTLAFDFSIMEVFVPLFHGGTLVIADRKTAKDNDLLVSEIEKHDVTYMQGTPAMWRLICQTDFQGGSHMTFVTGGEALPRDLIQPMLDRCGRLFNLYGPTETCVGSNMGQIQSADQRITVGPTFDNYNVYVVDQDGQLCPPETAGEVWIGGAGVTAGYQNRPELTAEKFVTFRDQTVYRSGDLGKITSEGNLEIVGRIDNQVKIAGHRIELEEIDAAMAACPNVKLAATVVEETSQGDVRLLGYVIAQENSTIDLANVRETISRSLPTYMIPALLTIVSEFPYTPSGKLDRKSFPPPSTDRPDLATAYVAPKTEAEKTLCQIFSEVLAINKVGLHDNFFEMGGNSIRAIKLVALVNERTALRIAAAEFYDTPSVGQIMDAWAGDQFSDDQRFASKGHSDPEAKVSVGSDGTSSPQFAIIGLAARLPGADSVDQFWANLIGGKESIRFFTPGELDPLIPAAIRESENYVSARGIIEDADHFDARFFGIVPREAEMIDPQQRIMLETAWTALEHAGCVPETFDGKIGIWAGTYATSYYSQILLRNPEAISQFGEFSTLVANEKDFIATRVAHRLNLTGPAINVNTACSTSLVAIIEACTALAAGHCDAAIAGGTSVQFPQHQGHVHQQGNIFTPDGHCRPFDAQAAGTLFSDGAGAVVIKRLDDAIEQGDHIWAVIRGYGINNDGGKKASFSAPSIDGQAGAIAMALDHAGVEADSIGYIEAHGTATLIGDPIEVTALKRVFESRTDKKQFCKIGSAKSNVGHTVAAAGVTGLIKTVLSLHHRQIPKTLHFEKPNPQIDFENSPFSVASEHSRWPESDQPRRAGVSAFGVGGTNAHIVLEEAPPRSTVAAQGIATQQPVQVFPVSAKTKSGLQRRMQQLAEMLSDCPATPENAVHDIATTLQQGRDAQQHRGLVVATSATEAAQKFDRGKMPDVMMGKSTASDREIVFMFPGQGAQYVRMGHNLYQHNAVFKTAMDRCSEILKGPLGRDLREILFPQPGQESVSQEILKNTRYTQPALFSLGYALAQVWMDWGVTPDRLLGHSIGEFAAACVAGVFSLEDGLKMIAKRGQLMESLPGGSMLSVRKNGGEVESLMTGDLAVAAYNGPELCVVAGPVEQVAQLANRLESQDIACRALHTSHAFHSSMMDSIVDPFETFISEIDLQPPQLPIISTVTGQPMTDAQATSPRYWAEHLRRPVKFSNAVECIWSDDQSRILMELGPRKTLATLAMQHAQDRKTQIAIPSLSSHAQDDEEFKAMLSAAGSLWLSGVGIDWKKLTIQQGRKIPLPTYRFERKKFFVQPVLGVPYQKPPLESPQPPSGDDQSQSPPTTIESSSPVIAHPQPTQAPSKKANTAMSRLPQITQSIYEVFENTSGYDLTEFEGDTTFFEMGLDSLVLTQTATALKKEFDVNITFRQLLEQFPTVDALAEFLDSEAPAEKFASSAPAEVVADTVVDVAAAAATSVVETEPPMAAAPMQQIEMPTSTVMPAMPVQAATPAASRMATDPSVQSVIQNQLQLMASQLQLLGGAAPAGVAVASAPVVTPAAASVAVTAGNPTPQLPAPTESPVAPINAGKSDDAGEAKKKAFGAAARVTLSAETLSDDQSKALQDLIRLQCEAMPKSKAFAQEHRKYLADPRTVSGFRPDLKELVFPVVVDRTKGVNLWDLDGNKYIDFTCGFGSNFLGHVPDFVVDAVTDQLKTDYSIGPQTPLAGEVAKLVHELTGNERTAFASTGSEAVMCCTRLARTYTGKDLIVYFSDDYHGILDEVIVRGNSKLKSFPAATGIPKSHVENALILPWADPKSLDIIRERIDELAGICLEPVQGRRPECQPKEFIQALRDITEDVDTALIFDEVITGFRIAPGGAQEFYGIRADLCSYGKVCGGGLPIGMISGKAKYMDGLDGGYWEFGDDSRPEAGMTYFAGTFLRHPPALRASKAILSYIQQQGQPLYDRINALGDYASEQLNAMFQRMEVPMVAGNFGTLFKVQITEELNYSELIFSGLRRRGMFMWDHRPNLMTTQHTQADVDAMVAAFEETLCELQPMGFVPGEGYKNAKPKFDASQPPKPEAKIGKDRSGNQAWFVPDAANPGQFTQVSQSSLS